MNVRITAEATADLESIGDRIARDSPRRAISFIQELRAKCLELANIPEGFPPVQHDEADGVRRRVHGAYLIFYRVRTDEVTVLHVLHGAMDYAAILPPSGSS